MIVIQWKDSIIQNYNRNIENNCSKGLTELSDTAHHVLNEESSSKRLIPEIIHN